MPSNMNADSRTRMMYPPTATRNVRWWANRDQRWTPRPNPFGKPQRDPTGEQDDGGDNGEPEVCLLTRVPLAGVGRAVAGASVGAGGAEPAAVFPVEAHRRCPHDDHRGDAEGESDADPRVCDAHRLAAAEQVRQPEHPRVAERKTRQHQFRKGDRHLPVDHAFDESIAHNAALGPDGPRFVRAHDGGHDRSFDAATSI